MILFRTALPWIIAIACLFASHAFAYTITLSSTESSASLAADNCTSPMTMTNVATKQIQTQGMGALLMPSIPQSVCVHPSTHISQNQNDQAIASFQFFDALGRNAPVRFDATAGNLVASNTAADTMWLASRVTTCRKSGLF